MQIVPTIALQILNSLKYNIALRKITIGNEAQKTFANKKVSAIYLKAVQIYVYTHILYNVRRFLLFHREIIKLQIASSLYTGLNLNKLSNIKINKVLNPISNSTEKGKKLYIINN